MSSKRKQVKKGGFEYAKMLSNPLSPCYRPEGKPEIFKAGWHAGGSTRPCDYEPSVCQMGVINKPLTDVVNPSQQAWFNRYSCPKGTQAGGKKTKKSKSKKTVKKTVKKSKSKKTKKSVKKTVKKSTKKSVKKTVKKSKSKKSKRTRSRK